MGMPPIDSTFFLGRPLEPPLAKTKAHVVVMKLIAVALLG
jgi:hypothetical protein